MKFDGAAFTQASGPVLTVVAPHGQGPRDGVQVGHNGAKPDAARKVEQSITYMMEHLNQPLQVAKLAQTAHISPSHFFVLFKRWAGFSPIDYFIRLRMHQASRLLAATTLSVKEIAADLG